MTKTEVCPYCGQKITRKKFDEIRIRIKIEEEEKLRKQREELDKDFEEREKEHERRIKELKKLGKEDKKKLEESLKREFEEERTEYEDKLEELKQRRKEGVKRLKEEYKSRLKEEVKERVEEESEKKDREIEKIRLQDLKDKGALEKQVEELKRKLEHKTAEELGIGAQEDVLHLLAREFPGDRIEMLTRGKKASDIKQTVMDSGRECGWIIYEVKNVKTWSNDFVEQAKRYKIVHSTPYVILVSNVLPAKERFITRLDGIIVVHPSKVRYIASLIRDSVIQLALTKLSQQEREAKVDDIYKYLTSEDFKQRVEAIFGGIEKLNRLQKKERRSHELTWAKQQKEHEKLTANASQIEGKIKSIIEGEVIVVKVPIQSKSKKKKKKKR